MVKIQLTKEEKHVILQMELNRALRFEDIAKKTAMSHKELSVILDKLMKKGLISEKIPQCNN